MNQLTEKQVKTLTDAAIVYKDAVLRTPELTGKGDFGTLIVNEKDAEIMQLIDLGLAVEEKYDEELNRAVKELQEAKQITLRVLNLTREAVLMFVDAGKRGVN